MSTTIDPTATGFLLAESRTQPMHVGGLHLYRKAGDAGRHAAREMYEQFLAVDEVAPLFLRHPKSARGRFVWEEDQHFDIDYHVRHSALPKPGRVRELLELCSRLHSTRLAWDRPLWEVNLIEGLRDGRIAVYTKIHHALVDGVSSMRLIQSGLTTDPDRRSMPPIWDADAPARARRQRADAEQLAEVKVTPSVLRGALALSAEAAGMPGALVKTLSRGLRNETSAVSLYAPRTILNQTITGARRVAADDWPLTRLRAVSKASSVTVNDVVLAMSSGALRRYLSDLDALPDRTLIAMVPIGLNAKQSQIASAEGGNAVASVMVQLGTHLADPADRLAAIHASMLDGKRALSGMTPLQILAMSAIGMSPTVLTPLLGLQDKVRPPYNLVISNVPGPRSPMFFNGAELVGMYPMSIPTHGIGLNITCTSYADKMCFGLTGDRRTVPHLQRMLHHLDLELRALERAAGVN